MDEQKFKDFIEHELNRKEKFSEWQQLYSEKNEDLEKAKQLIREESRKTLETSMPQTVEKDFKAKDEKRQSTTGARAKYMSTFIYVLFDRFIQDYISLSLSLRPSLMFDFQDLF